MDFSKLNSLISRRKKTLQEDLLTENEDVLFFDKVVTENTMSNIEGLLSLNTLEVMTAYLYTFSNRLSINEIKNSLEKNKELITGDLKEYLEDVIDYIYTEKQYDINSNSLRKKLKKILEKISSKNNLFDIDKFRELYNIYDEEFLKIVGMVIAINKIEKDYIFRLLDIEGMSSVLGIRKSEKSKKEFVESTLKDEYRIDEIIKDLSVIGEYYREISSNEKKRKVSIRKNLSNYDELLKQIKYGGLNLKSILDIKYYEKIIKLIDKEDKNILKELLYQINKELDKHYNKVNKEYTKLSNDNQNNIRSIFDKYGYNFNSMSLDIKNKILDMDIEELDSYLSNIKELGILDDKIICECFKNSDFETIDYLVSLKKRGVITIDFIIANKLYIKNNCELLGEKIEFLLLLGVNIRNFINNLDVYCIDYKLLKNNITILNQYRLLNSLNKLNSFELLKDNSLCTKIDYLLELGYENTLDVNIELLNLDLKEIRKLYILKNLNMLPVGEEIINVLGKLNYVDDSYIFNFVEYKLLGEKIDTTNLDFSILELNDVLCNNSRVIDINGVYLSKNRIMRNFELLKNSNLSDNEKLVYSILYGSILTEEEYNAVMSNKDTIIKKLSI